MSVKILDLPDELLCKIFQCCDVVSLMALEQVSSRFSDLVTSDPIVELRRMENRCRCLRYLMVPAAVNRDQCRWPGLSNVRSANGKVRALQQLKEGSLVQRMMTYYASQNLQGSCCDEILLQTLRTEIDQILAGIARNDCTMKALGLMYYLEDEDQPLGPHKHDDGPMLSIEEQIHQLSSGSNILRAVGRNCLTLVYRVPTVRDPSETVNRLLTCPLQFFCQPEDVRHAEGLRRNAATLDSQRLAAGLYRGDFSRIALGGYLLWIYDEPLAELSDNKLLWMRNMVDVAAETARSDGEGVTALTIIIDCSRFPGNHPGEANDRGLRPYQVAVSVGLIDRSYPLDWAIFRGHYHEELRESCIDAVHWMLHSNCRNDDRRARAAIAARNPDFMSKIQGFEVDRILTSDGRFVTLQDTWNQAFIR